MEIALVYTVIVRLMAKVVLSKRYLCVYKRLVRFVAVIIL